MLHDSLGASEDFYAKASETLLFGFLVGEEMGFVRPDVDLMMKIPGEKKRASEGGGLCL